MIRQQLHHNFWTDIWIHVSDLWGSGLSLKIQFILNFGVYIDRFAIFITLITVSCWFITNRLHVAHTLQVDTIKLQTECRLQTDSILLPFYWHTKVTLKTPTDCKLSQTSSLSSKQLFWKWNNCKLIVTQHLWLQHCVWLYHYGAHHTVFTDLHYVICWGENDLPAVNQQQNQQPIDGWVRLRLLKCSLHFYIQTAEC